MVLVFAAYTKHGMYDGYINHRGEGHPLHEAKFYATKGRCSARVKQYMRYAGTSLDSNLPVWEIHSFEVTLKDKHVVTR